MMWPFRKRKDKPVRPPINEDWQVGDQAECLANAKDWHGVEGPELGDVATVTGVFAGHYSNGTGPAWGLSLVTFGAAKFDALEFRKVPLRSAACDAEFAARIKALKPKRVRA